MRNPSEVSFWRSITWIFDWENTCCYGDDYHHSEIAIILLKSSKTQSCHAGWVAMAMGLCKHRHQRIMIGLFSLAGIDADTNINKPTVCIPETNLSIFNDKKWAKKQEQRSI